MKNVTRTYRLISSLALCLIVACNNDSDASGDTGAADAGDLGGFDGAGSDVGTDAVGDVHADADSGTDTEPDV